MRPVSRRHVIVGGVSMLLAGCSTPPAARGPAGGSSAETATTGSDLPTTAGPPSSPASSSSVAAGGAARFVDHGRRDSDRVSLTFHASGDTVLATRLLDVLAGRSVHVTVFAVCNWLGAHPDLAARIRADGHELANHTYSHKAMGGLGRSEIRDEIIRGAAVLEQLTGSITPWFRPSGIEVPTEAILIEAGAAGYPVSVGYDVDSLDFEDPGRDAVIANIARSVRAGSIVSLHFGHRGTIDAVPAVLDHIEALGWRAVTVGELLA